MLRTKAYFRKNGYRMPLVPSGCGGVDFDQARVALGFFLCKVHGGVRPFSNLLSATKIGSPPKLRIGSVRY